MGSETPNLLPERQRGGGDCAVLKRRNIQEKGPTEKTRNQKRVRVGDEWVKGEETQEAGGGRYVMLELE